MCLSGQTNPKKSKSWQMRRKYDFFKNSKVVLASIFSNHLMMVLKLGSVYQGGGRHSYASGSVWFMDW